MKELAARYEPKRIEDAIYARWESASAFHSEPDPAKKSYTIVIPPPNVTGALHMGHALNNTIQDILIRWRRMQGCEALWIPGTDHAGIATQNVVEKDLAAKGLDRHAIGREKLIEAIWKWKEQYGDRIIEQLKRLGSSCDWQRLRFTMDEGLSRAVREAFVTLYERGLIYRGDYIINWCPRCHTALADDEVEHQEVAGHLWHLRYPFAEGEGGVVVATTRPETMLGDTAIAVNPKDERYAALLDNDILLPVIGRRIRFIRDDLVDPDFGTGAVKVTPAHDPNDFEIGRRHGLELVNVMHDDGRMNENAGPFAGLDRFEAREKLVARFEKDGTLVKVEDHAHSVGHCYRCQTVVEPRVSLQWFVSTKPLAAKALKACDEGKVSFWPPRWEKFYRSWLENVRDWCISRQIWWGHRLPAWHCDDCGEMTVAKVDPDACASCASENIHQDEDVLDTWFSSALWPFSTLGWPREKAEELLGYYYPTSVLVTDRGIIYFWVARMVMMGLEMMGKVPFDDVFIHGTILDEIGRKMSKSLGNGVDPIEMIDEFGADAVRYSLILLTTEGQDVRLSENRFQMGRNFANKLWNAARFAFMSLEGPEPDFARAERGFHDRWILSRFETARAEVTEALERFALNEAAVRVYDFVWHDFCDWYLELIKPVLREGGGSADAARATLARVLDGALRLLHPFVPFITEELWSDLGEVAPWRETDAGDGLLIRTPWPAENAELLWPDGERDLAALQDVVRGVRNIRSKMNIGPRVELTALCSVDESMKTDLDALSPLIRNIAALSRFEVGRDLARPLASATHVGDGMRLYVPLADFIDLDAERARLEKQREKFSGMIRANEAKLSNPNFVDKAPADIVERVKRQQAEAREKLEAVMESLAALD